MILSHLSSLAPALQLIGYSKTLEKGQQPLTGIVYGSPRPPQPRSRNLGGGYQLVPEGSWTGLGKSLYTIPNTTLN